jgi:hypothetical protein
MLLAFWPNVAVGKQVMSLAIVFGRCAAGVPIFVTPASAFSPHIDFLKFQPLNLRTIISDMLTFQYMERVLSLIKYPTSKESASWQTDMH